MGEFHWYVSAYRLSFEDFSKGGEAGPLCKDEDELASMFRVVFKANLTHTMADDLFNRVNEIMEHYKEVEPEQVQVETPAELDEITPMSSRQSLLAGARNSRNSVSVRRAMSVRKSMLNDSTMNFSNQHAAC